MHEEPQADAELLAVARHRRVRAMAREGARVLASAVVVLLVVAQALGDPHVLLALRVLCVS